MTTKTTRPDSRMSVAEVVEEAQRLYHLARTTDGLLVAYPRAAGRLRVVTEIRALRAKLILHFQGIGQAVSRQTMDDALLGLSAIATTAPEVRAHLRVGQHGPAVYLDLGATLSDSSFIEVSPFGWELVDAAEREEGDALPIFRRTSATKELPAPERPGPGDDPRAEFAELLGLSPDDDRFRLLWGWLVAALFERSPRPILWALGPQGSGKSTRARMILSVLEPCDALGRPPGDSERDDSTSARGRYLPSWDNIGSIGAKTSDWLCRLVTGVEIDRRTLFTDDDVRTTVLRRSGVATSIVLPYGLGPDALERLVLLEFDRMPDADRRTESELWEAFHRLHPRLLGALLDDVAGTLRALQSVRAQPPPRLPRMADYALVLAALDLHRGPGHLDAYVSAVTDVLASRAVEDPFTAGLIAVASSAEDKTWKGTAEALYKRLEPFRPDDPRAPWPRSSRSLGHAVTNASETLRAAGLEVVRSKSGATRLLTLRLVGTNLAAAG